MAVDTAIKRKSATHNLKFWISGGFPGASAVALRQAATWSYAIKGFRFLDGNAQWSNIERSLNNYVRTNIGTTDALGIDYLGLPFDDTAVIEWVQPRMMNIKADYAGDGSSTQYAEDANVEFWIECYVKKSGATIADRHYVLRDIVANYFKIGQDIPIIDYVNNSGVVDNMRVRRIIGDSPGQETQTFYKYTIGWEMDYTRLTTK